MPSDANGVYSLPPGYLAKEGEVVQPSQHNPPLEDIAAALTARLSRSGVAPMTGPLRLADGTANEPSLTFNSNAGIGFYKDGNSLAVTGPIKGLLPIGLGPLPWSLTSVPVGWVLCYGQTLSRAAYPDLWTVAQAEIAAGNTLYNNGDGVSTFGILDMRGRLAAGKDNMGGTQANRLTFANGGINGTSLGGTGGQESIFFAREGFPNIAPAFEGITDPVSVTSTTSDISRQSFNFQAQGGGSNVQVVGASSAIVSTGTFTPRGLISSINGGVTQQRTRVLQPTIITNAILYAGA